MQETGKCNPYTLGVKNNKSCLWKQPDIKFHGKDLKIPIINVFKYERKTKIFTDKQKPR